MYRVLIKKLSPALGVMLACVTLAHAQAPTTQTTTAPPASIGTVTFLVGDTRLDRSGTITLLTKGQALQVDDHLLTGANGHIHASMVDNGFISVRPSGRLHIQSYTYTPQDPGANRVGLMLESGVARTISGKAGESARERYRFNTPLAAIGLRGTDYVVQALPDATRVSVLKGAVTLSAFGPSCLSASLSPCTGPLVRELAAGSPHAYMEVRAQGGLPVIIAPDQGKDAPNKVAPPRPEEVGATAERQLSNAIAANLLRNSSQAAEAQADAAALAKAKADADAAALAAAASKPPAGELIAVPLPQIVWGRWSSLALAGSATPNIASLITPDREITYGNELFGLFRPTNSVRFPGEGVISMNYRQGEAYLQVQQPGAAQQLTPASLSATKLQLDFNTHQFTTSLSATANDRTFDLHAQGRIHAQGLLLLDTTRSNMNLAGALSNNAQEAGYLFDANVAPNQNLVGATRWSR
jgi:hypothetical protein